MKKKCLLSMITAVIMSFTVLNVGAQEMEMYVKNQHVVRDVQTVNQFDMLPIMDIAGELGFNCSFDGTTINLYNDSELYTFTMGNASVYDKNGNWYGLDVVPQIINGKVRVPYKFFCDAMGLSYTWDNVTNTIFLGSDDTYNWLINTPEYQQGVRIKSTRDNLLGWWFYYESLPYMDHFSENLYFGADGSFYSKTWREQCYGSYVVSANNRIYVTYDYYFCGAGSSTYSYVETDSAEYALYGNTLKCIRTTYSDGRSYDSDKTYEHRSSFTDVGVQN